MEQKKAIETAEGKEYEKKKEKEKEKTIAGLTWAGTAGEVTVFTMVEAISFVPFILRPVGPPPSGRGREPAPEKAQLETSDAAVGRVPHQKLPCCGKTAQRMATG
ncbi:uncharacterized protein QC763_0030490 [Podospora pseudopauciseta]|uniref:Uncharacterized protein n=1 Tax=Podospora pseudopauciseta TaxID=2093780 RepID=A0ABR0HMB4_9PEZI|nr:hypothetical protein QC763_0030490 [Podospora pseudopauciseta]